MFLIYITDNYVVQAIVSRQMETRSFWRHAVNFFLCAIARHLVKAHDDGVNHNNEDIYDDEVYV